MTTEIDDWRSLLRNGLAEVDMEESPRQRDFDNLEWVACDACQAKPGWPTLCSGCLANRHTVAQLVGAIASWLEERGARARVGDLPLADFTIERLAADIRSGAWRLR